MIHIYDYTPFHCDGVARKVQKAIRKKFLGKVAGEGVEVEDIIADIERMVTVSNRKNPNAPQLEVHVCKNFSLIKDRWVIFIKYPKKKNSTTQDVCCSLFIAMPQEELNPGDLHPFNP